MAKKLVKCKSGLRMLPCENNNNNNSSSCTVSPLLLDEPPWQSDSSCQHCQLCSIRFDITTRRHHCRRCGSCLCSSCCSQRMPLPRMSFVDPVRLCHSCAQVTAKENEFFDKYLRALTSGCVFDYTSTDTASPTAAASSVLCSLSADQSQLKFYTMHGQQPQPVSLTSVQLFSVLSSDSMGQSEPQGVRIKHRNGLGELQQLELISRDCAGRRHTVIWIFGLQKALKMVSEHKRGQALSCSVK